MTTIDFWFDPVSPFAYLAFERLPEAFVGLSYNVAYRPIVFGALLKHWQHKGPAEIEPKRAWTFRHVHWLAQRHGVPLTTPLRHPFNSLALARLAWACAPEGGTPGRHACEAVLRHAWRPASESAEGTTGAVSPSAVQAAHDAEDPARLAELIGRLAPRLAPAGEAARAALRAATSAAIEQGLFGVPTIGVGDKLFWGFDALEMAAGCVRGDAWFDAAHWEREGAERPGVRRDPV
ncbi:MAG: DsbA family protein [Pseudomonadota bacterium]|nr:DsbA family protein [Pseudomonadota bacterium]